MEDLPCKLELDEALEDEPMEVEEEEEEELDNSPVNAKNDPEEILPDIVESQIPVPPLRPLTIAPKPTKAPIAYKTASGQQLYVVQANSAQALKLLSAVPQGLSLNNLQHGKAIAVRPATKVVPPTGFSTVQPKQVIMKKVIQPFKPAVFNNAKISALKEDSYQQTNATHNNVIASPAKVLTLAQAQQLGIVSGNKLVAQGKQTIVLPPKSQIIKPVKLLPQVKAPAKILPAPEAPNKVSRVIVKQTNAGIVTPLLQVPGAQPVIAGQLHQVNLPGKGVQYIKIIGSTVVSSGVTSSMTTSIANNKRLVLASGTDGKIPLLTSVNAIATTKMSSAATEDLPSKIKTNSSVRPILPTPGQLVLVPAPKVAIPQLKQPPAAPTSPRESNQSDVNLDANGMRPRKPCNCTRSQCLKLYCDCFANGEFCYMCNCNNCANNLQSEDTRLRAIRSCLDRNPLAFRPKIGKAKEMGEVPTRKHTKGCNCKRSGCLKNYCECYEAKIACSGNCKCIGCRNIEDMIDKKMVIIQNLQGPHPNASQLLSKVMQPLQLRRLSNKYAFSFLTDEVIEATSQCLLTTTVNADTHDEETLKHRIILEFSRCLTEIIECSSNRVVSTVN